MTAKSRSVSSGVTIDTNGKLESYLSDLSSKDHKTQERATKYIACATDDPSVSAVAMQSGAVSSLLSLAVLLLGKGLLSEVSTLQSILFNTFSSLDNITKYCYPQLKLDDSAPTFLYALTRSDLNQDTRFKVLSCISHMSSHVGFRSSLISCGFPKDWLKAGGTPSKRRSGDVIILNAVLASSFNFPPGIATILPQNRVRLQDEPEEKSQEDECPVSGSAKKDRRKSAKRTEESKIVRKLKYSDRSRSEGKSRKIRDSRPTPSKTLQVLCVWEKDYREISISLPIPLEALVQAIKCEYGVMPEKIKYHSETWKEFVTITKEADVSKFLAESAKVIYVFGKLDSSAGVPLPGAILGSALLSATNLGVNDQPADLSVETTELDSASRVGPELDSPVKSKERPGNNKVTCSIPFEHLDMRNSAVLGKGFFGEVRLAHWRRVPVAIKILYHKEFRQTTEIERFVREVEVLSKLRHPKVILFLGTSMDTERGELIIVTEYMARGSLYQYMQQAGGSLLSDQKMILRVATDIALGMNYLHGADILHRDLNCKNILLDTNLSAKVADFGLAKFRDGDENSNTMGAVAWMAPEIIENASYFTPASDVYSFAMTLWEMVTGHSPLEGFTPITFARKVLEEDYRPPITSTCPGFWKDLIEICWNTIPKLRPTFSQTLDMFQSVQVKRLVREHKSKENRKSGHRPKSGNHILDGESPLKSKSSSNNLEYQKQELLQSPSQQQLHQRSNASSNRETPRTEETPPPEKTPANIIDQELLVDGKKYPLRGDLADMLFLQRTTSRKVSPMASYDAASFLDTSPNAHNGSHSNTASQGGHSNGHHNNFTSTSNNSSNSGRREEGATAHSSSAHHSKPNLERSSSEFSRSRPKSQPMSPNGGIGHSNGAHSPLPVSNNNNNHHNNNHHHPQNHLTTLDLGDMLPEGRTNSSKMKHKRLKHRSEPKQTRISRGVSEAHHHNHKTTNSSNSNAIYNNFDRIEKKFKLDIGEGDGPTSPKQFKRLSMRTQLQPDSSKKTFYVPNRPKHVSASASFNEGKLLLDSGRVRGAREGGVDFEGERDRGRHSSSLYSPPSSSSISSSATLSVNQSSGVIKGRDARKFSSPSRLSPKAASTVAEDNYLEEETLSDGA